MKQLLIIILIVLGYLFIKRWLRDKLSEARDTAGSRAGAHKGGATRNTPDTAEDMVQDPNCRTFVPVSRALTYRHDGRTLHFCSEDCANEYARKLKSGEI